MIILENLIIHEEYLREGRKQAREILGEYADFIVIVDDEELPLLQVLDDLDPTPSRKYVAIFARMFKNILKELIKTKGYPSKPSPDMLQKYKDGLTLHIKQFVDDIDPELIKGAEDKGFKEDLSKVDTVPRLNLLLKKVVTAITRSTIKKGVQGLTEGKDFAIIFENEKVLGLMPFSWEASKILASAYVGGCTGKWCIAYQKQSNYWQDYVEQRGQAPVYMIPKDNPEKKYSFMFSDDEGLDVWDEEDDNLSAQEQVSLFDELNLKSDDISEIESKALSTARKNIENFNTGSVTRLLSSSYGIYDNEFHGWVSIDIIRNDDGETEDSEGTSATLIEGKDFYKEEEGLALCDHIFKEADDLEQFPNILDKCLVVDYGDNYSFATIVNRFSNNHQYDDLNHDGSLYNLDTDYTTLIFSSTKENSYSDEPIQDSLFSRSPKKLKFKVDDIYYTIYTESQESILDAIKRFPRVNALYTGEWQQDEETEKKFGQGFLQYEKKQGKPKKRI